MNLNLEGNHRGRSCYGVMPPCWAQATPCLLEVPHLLQGLLGRPRGLEPHTHSAGGRDQHTKTWPNGHHKPGNLRSIRHRSTAWDSQHKTHVPVHRISRATSLESPPGLLHRTAQLTLSQTHCPSPGKALRWDSP